MEAARRVTWAAIALIGSVAVALALTGQAGAQGAQELPEELETAIVNYMETEIEDESTGMDCDTALEEGATPGNWCYEVEALGENEATVRFGPLQSEFVESVTFTRQDDGTWAAGGATPEPPATGTGLAEEGSSAGSAWAAGTALVVAVGLGTATYVQARRKERRQ